MSPFVWGGIIISAVCLAAYFWTARKYKRTPQQKDFSAILISGIGIGSGIKILAFVFSGELIRLIEANKASEKLLRLSEEDTVFFLLGAGALIWSSAEAIIELFARLKKDSEGTQT